ncbi:hypothetical protein [Bradyrhizobium sp.]
MTICGTSRTAPRDDGKKMWAYKGRPLYTFKGAL